jgi:hypothetical protein
MFRPRGWAVGGLLALAMTLIIGGSAYPAPPSPGPGSAPCGVDRRLVPTCGVLWGAAAAAHTPTPVTQAVHDFEQRTGRTQTVFHTYHRGIATLFPTAEEIALADEPGHHRIPFINWKPATGTWADIARGEPAVDDYLDRVAAHIKADFPNRFFLTVHHEPENDVDPRAGSGYTATDYAAMFRHVVLRLRADGVTNAVTVMTYMAYPKWCVQPWHDQLYPGADVVDWVAWDVYASSAPGYGYGDFGELMNRGGAGDQIRDLVRTALATFQWPGFYNWAATRFPDKPLMLGEWGVWYDQRNAGHKPWFFDNVAQEIANYPRIKALVYFDSPNAEGRSSSVDAPADALPAYQRLGARPEFQVDIDAPPPSDPPSPSPSDPSPSDPASPPPVNPTPSGPGSPAPPPSAPPSIPPDPPASPPTSPPGTPASPPASPAAFTALRSVTAPSANRGTAPVARSQRAA